MQYRRLGNSGLSVSAISMGCWAIGGSWGTVTDESSMRALHAAVDRGVDFFDTADVYGDGRSERLVGRLLRERREDLIVATKAGRRLSPHEPAGYNGENLTAFVERSLRNLGTERIDLLQLHCPPTEVYYRPEVFEALDRLVASGKVAHYGVSVEKVEEGLKALGFPGVRSIQVIYNVFRQRPAERLFQQALESGVGILARVPLASGLLTGKLSSESRFEADDHRAFNRHGEVFDQGETFSGVPLEAGFEAVERIRAIVPAKMSLSQLALRFILDHPAVSCAIPGGKNETQVDQNCAAAELPPLDAALHEQLAAIYREVIAPHVHQRW